ncbi:MAG: hypothetical protein E7258_09420 [Lachnospiraceae bacterium]|nr:hypothetical protein [Lachnospiraceae bacterium]
MELNGINSTSYTSAAYTATSTKPVSKVEPAVTEEAAAVYEKSEATSSATYTSKNPKVDQATIDKLKADAEARYAQLASLVEKLMTKQGESSYIASLGDLMTAVKEGKFDVSPEAIEQAKKDVAEDGYWGVEQTATRIVDFAKALTGGDPSKIEDMRGAIEDGFGQAAKLWGSDLPEISQNTYDRVNELLDEWASETTSTVL